MAQTTVANELQALAQELRHEGRADEAAIFDAQVLFANAPALTMEVQRWLDEGMSLQQAVLKATEHFATMLSNPDDPYLQARAAARAIDEQWQKAGTIGTLVLD
jgi:phosphoenolpyruvate-protein kinase (PTS system EI component)